MQKPSHHAAKEQNRNEYGDQGKRHRNDGESNFLRSEDRGLVTCFPHLHVADDVFQHDDRVVHDKAHGKRERHQGKDVQAVAKQIHRRKRPNNRQHHGRTGNQGRRQVAEEQEDHHDNERYGDDQRELHIVNRSADSLGSVIEQFQLHRWRQRGLQFGKERANTVDDLHCVRSRLS